ncbi:hypothetical protein AMJ80_02370 [bacterium SM23_31]|nr:MAG: hypothetical protein AMJ80_02370 [bacterium SM23_31]
MSNWQIRSREVIKFTSPDGNVFEGLWRGNSVPQEKTVAIFNYPKVKGSIVQDLDVNSSRYPMTIYFEGPDNDIESQRFQAAFNETGLWTVVHPVLGEKILQPLSFSPLIDPVGSGNITAVTTEWVEPISDQLILSVQELAQRIQEQQEQLGVQSAAQFEQNVTQDTAAERLAVTKLTGESLTAYEQTLQNLAELNADINEQVASIQQEIQDTIIQPVIDIQSLAGQVQSLIELPGLVVNDFFSRLESYSSFATSIFNLSPDTTDTEGINEVSTQEVFLSAVIGMTGIIAITADFQTRPEAIQAIEDVNNLFLTITETLDSIQSNFSDNPIDIQYFSQSQSFSNAALLIAYTSAYLLEASIDLKIEKRFTLEKDRAPIEIVITEYGNTGENDENLELFIATNGLKGNDILILPAGREVVVYV